MAFYISKNGYIPASAQTGRKVDGRLIPCGRYLASMPGKD
jgi:hypothetical protein